MPGKRKSNLYQRSVGGRAKTFDRSQETSLQVELRKNEQAIRQTTLRTTGTSEQVASRRVHVGNNMLLACHLSVLVKRKNSHKLGVQNKLSSRLAQEVPKHWSKPTAGVNRCRNMWRPRGQQRPSRKY